MRYWMEDLGWLQGSLVKQENVRQLLTIFGNDELVKDSTNIVLIVASGSCDVANSNDLVVEFSVARFKDKIDGNYNFNKNPRILHCNLESSMVDGFCIELKAYEKISIKKDRIPENILPDPGIRFSQNELFYYVEWLSGRYKRPAFPTEFDTRIDRVWKKEKRKKEASKISEKVMGIYAKIYPDREIGPDEKYSVDLLAIVVPDLEEKGLEYGKIEDFLKHYKEMLKKAKMEVGDIKITYELKISLGTFKQYKRFNLDELSFKANHPLPPEYELG